MIWDDLRVVKRQFPRDRYEWIAVSSEEDGRQIVARLVMASGASMLLEARWFSEDSGVLLVPREEYAEALKNLPVPYGQALSEMRAEDESERGSNERESEGWFARLIRRVFGNG